MRKQLIIIARRSASRLTRRPAGRLTVTLAALATGVVLVAGCSNATPMPGQNGPTSADSPSATAPPTTITTSSGLPGLSGDCSQAINAQLAISTLFAGAVDGKALTADQVSTTFSPLQGQVPATLTDDIEVLHQAAKASVGKSAVEVADTVNGSKVSGAMSALTAYVGKCTPTTS